MLGKKQTSVPHLLQKCYDLCTRHTESGRESHFIHNTSINVLIFFLLLSKNGYYILFLIPAWYCFISNKTYILLISRGKIYEYKKL